MQPQRRELRAEALLESFDQPAEPRLRLGDREVAVRLARAGDRVAAHGIDVEREADLRERGGRLGHALVRDAGDDEVLLARQADVAAVALGQIRQRDHLVAGDEAEVHRHADVREAFLLLRVHAEVVRRLDVDRGQRVVLDCAPELCLDALADPLGADVVDHELEARLDARDAVLEVLRPHRRDRAEDLVRLLLRHEDAHVARDPRHRREPAADDDAEALAAVLVHDADQRDAVDLRRVAAVGAGRDRVLVLARQVRPVGVAVEEVGGRLDDRRGVEELVARDPLHRAAGDVAHRVAATAGGRHARGFEVREDVGQLRELEPVELDVLPRGELAVALAVEHAHGVGVIVRRGDVELAVAVELTRHHRLGYWPTA